jgi:putative FmdB family regulatory protein
MPLYEYRCGVCGAKEEVSHKFYEAPISRCQSCDNVLKKVITAPAIHFNGPGFYVNDKTSKESEKDA